MEGKKMMEEKILYLVDTKEYVETNCFQQQLLQGFRALDMKIDILPFYPKALWPIRSKFYNPKKYSRIISVLRQRTLNQIWPQLKVWLKDSPITIYDQDPWEGYIDTSSTKGVYETLKTHLNLEKIYVTAPYWAHYLVNRGHNASWVRMGISSAFCDVGRRFEDRLVNVGFRGAMHPHRKVVFDILEGAGVKVTLSQDRLDYDGYMSYLQQLKFFTHDESAPWICDGEPISRSTSMWIKSVETASRGTFCLRNFHEEGHAYGLKEIPLIQCYEDPRQAPDIISKIYKMDREEIYDIQRKSVEYIRGRDDWLNAAKIMVNNS